ncbi:MAG: PQQ-binding-like beta-propeller repeat protein [Gemmataceae bacterium]
MKTRTISVLVLLAGISGANWPAFRGPNGDGHSDAAEVPLRWSEDKNVVWKTALPGHGWSSPVVWGKSVWLTTATAEGKELFALELDLDTGKLLRKIKVFDVAEPKPKIVEGSSYASPTPIIEAGRLYVHFGTYGTACLNTADGKKIWERRDLELDHKEGAGSSPLLYKNLLFIPCDGQDVQYLAALDCKTGKTIWKTQRTADFKNTVPYQRKAYVTPVIAKVGEHDQLISPGARAAYAYDPVTGRELWKITYKGWSNVSGPVCGHGLVFLNAGYGAIELIAVKPTGMGDVSASHIDWRLAQGIPGLSSPVLVGEHIYVCTEKGVASCIEAKTGKVIWKERLNGPVSASPIAVADRIYFPDENGRTTVIAASPKFKVLAVNALDGKLRASPAVAGKSLLLRSDSHLYRIEEK